MTASNFTGDLRVPHIAEDTNGYPIDCEEVVVGGVTYYRQRVNAHSYHLDVDSGLYVPNVGHHGMQHTVDYLSAIGIGKVSGHEQFFSLGYNPDIDATQEDICEWGGTYVFPTAGGIQMTIVSTSTEDAAAGTGVAQVEINYLDANYAEQTERRTITGTDPVTTTATNILRVNYFHTYALGSSGSNTGSAVGNITLKNGAGMQTYAMIPALGNFSRHGVFTVPANKAAFLTYWDIGAGGATAGKLVRAMLRATCTHDGVLTPGIFQYKRMTIVMDAVHAMEFRIPLKVPATADIKVSAFDETNAVVTTYFEGWME